MKIRNDYVSNSSSSSFVVVGQKFNAGDIKDAIVKKLGEDKIVQLVKENCEWISGDTVDEIYEDGGLTGIVEAVGGSNMCCFVEGGYDADESSDAVIGIDPTNAADDETIGSLKDNVAKRLEEIGLTPDRSKISIITGGTDSGGYTFIESCG